MLATSCIALSSSACGELLDLDRFEPAEASGSATSGGGNGDAGGVAVGTGGTGGAGGGPPSVEFYALADNLNDPKLLSAGDGEVYFAGAARMAIGNEPVYRLSTRDLVGTAMLVPETMFDADLGTSQTAIDSNRLVQAIQPMDDGVVFYRGNHASEDRIVSVKMPGVIDRQQFLPGTNAPIYFTRVGDELLGAHLTNGGGATPPIHAIRWPTSGTLQHCVLTMAPGFGEIVAVGTSLYVSRPNVIERISLSVPFNQMDCDTTVFDSASLSSLLRYDGTDYLVWRTPDGIFRRRSGTGADPAMEVVATMDPIRDMEVFEGRVYWLTGGDRLFVAEVDGEPGGQLLAQFGTRTSELAVNADGLFVLQPDAGELLRAPLPNRP